MCDYNNELPFEALCPHFESPCLCLEPECTDEREERLAILTVDGGLTEDEARRAFCPKEEEK